MDGKYIITVDLGGTKILTAVINDKKEIIERVKLVTDASQGPEKLVDSVAESVNMAVEKAGLKQDDVSAVCMGVPGTVNPGTGFIGNAPNLNITGFNIKEALAGKIPYPVLIENDVNLAALGIKKYEFDDKVNNMLVVFVGTGIGGALILNGKLYRGSAFYAGEIGHMKVNADGTLTGSKGKKTFEEIASRTAMVKAIEDDIDDGKKSVLSEYIIGGKPIKSKALANAVTEGDKVAKKRIKKGCKVIGTVLGSITTLLNVDTIVLGGGVVEAMGDYMLPVIEKSFNKAVLKEPGKTVQMVVTELGDDAPLYGGIALAEEFGVL